MKSKNTFKILLTLFTLSLTACSSTYDATNKGAANSINNNDYVNDSMVFDSNNMQINPLNKDANQFSEQSNNANKKIEPQGDIENIVYFAFDTSIITSEYQKILQLHADFLTKNINVVIIIEGHTDELGTPEYNIALGENRAKAVMNYLIALGVLPSQMKIVSYGEEMPLMLGQTEQAYAKNRRAVLVY